MQIRLDKLKARPRTVDFSEPASGFPALTELVEQGDIEFTAPLQGELIATWAGDAIEVSGRLTTAVQQPCSRCLQRVPCELDIEVLLCYTPARSDSDVVEEEKELSADEMGLILVEGDELDLRPEIAQEVIMAFPRKPLCQQECAGLCPVCGADQNREKCNCDPPVFHAGLAALKNFKVDH